MVYKYKRKIFGYECDIYGHLNNSNYLNIYEEARAYVFSSLGCPIKKLKEKSINVVINKTQIDFKKEVALDEEIIVETKIIHMNQVKINWVQKIRDEKNNMLNKCETTTVFTKMKKPVRIDKSIYDYLLDNNKLCGT